MGYLQDMVRFAWAVLNNWAGWTTGGVIVALVSVWFMLRQAPIPRKVVIVLALVFLFLAFFSAWREQYRMAKQAAQDVPDLHGWIDGAIVGEGSVEPHGPVMPTVFLIVSIKNLKMPSIVQGYTCVGRTPDGTSFTGRSQTIPKDVTLQGAWGTKDFPNLAPLYDKTAETPIERGGMRRGVLFFVFPEAKAVFGAGSRFEVTFEDVLGRKSSADVTIRREGKAPMYYPGMQKQ